MAARATAAVRPRRSAEMPAVAGDPYGNRSVVGCWNKKQTLHVTISDQVCLQPREAHQNIRIPEADADEPRMTLDQFIQCPGSRLGQRYAASLSRAYAAIHRDNNNVSAPCFIDRFGNFNV